MASTPQTVSPPAAASSPAAATGVPSPSSRSLLRRTLLIVGVLVALIAGTYALAWYRASSLASTYLTDADTSYDAGKYLEALVGYEDFDPARDAYVTHGGYLHVERIWKDPNANPKPPGVERAIARIDEIINQRLTIEQAERFIEVNAGRGNPYLGVIYLRLGELYEQEGALRDARDIYSSVPELFRDETDLVSQAQAHLARLEGK